MTKKVTIKNNKDSNIILINGEKDKLSHELIYGMKDPFDLANAFSERIDYSCYSLSQKLPKELKNDFEVKTRLVGDKLSYYLKPTNDESYKRNPLKINVELKIPVGEFPNGFTEDEIWKLQKEANKNKKPVKIPYIVGMKEYIGKYENPFSVLNSSSITGSELYIMPEKIPPAKEYTIELFNEICSFKLEKIKLERIETGEDFFVLSNNNDTGKFDVKLKFSFDDIEVVDGLESTMCNLKIDIAIREKYVSDCSTNLDLLKFNFLTSDAKSNFVFINLEDDVELFRNDMNGDIDFTEEDYMEFKDIIDLVDKIIYISKVKKMKIDFDLQYFQENKEKINLLYSELTGNDYTFKNAVNWDFLIFNYNEEQLRSLIKDTVIETEFKDLELFDEIFDFKNNRVILEQCEITDLIKNFKDGNDLLKLKVSKCTFKIVRE